MATRTLLFRLPARLAALGFVVSLAVGSASAASGCGETPDAPTVFPIANDAGSEFTPVYDPDLAGGISGLFGAGCAQAKGQASRVPVYMLLVLDGSGSMIYDGKWPAVVAALGGIFDDLKVQASPAVGAGLTVFADRRDLTIGETTAGPYSKMDVPIGFIDIAQHTKLRERVDLTEPHLGTPTFEVLSGQYPLLEAYNGGANLESGGKRVLVFVSDGVPDPDMPAGENEVPFSLDAAQKAFQKGLLTFAVGVGAIGDAGTKRYDPAFMGGLAVAGGTANQPCDPLEKSNPANMCHFQITPGGKSVPQLTQEFTDALTRIRSKVLSCEFKLDRGKGELDPAKINVVYSAGSGSQSLLPQSSADGWSFDDPATPSKVVLNGATCDRVKNDPKAKIDIIVGCKTIVK